MAGWLVPQRTRSVARMKPSGESTQHARVSGPPGTRKGRGVSGSVRRGIALSPQLAKHTVYQMAAHTEILKQRRKAREESEATKSKKK